MLTRSELTKRALKTKLIKVDGGEVLIRELSGADMTNYMELSNSDNPRIIDLLIAVCQACMVDEEGEKLFTDKQLDEVGNLPYAVLKAVQEPALILSGLIGDEEEDNDKPARPMSKKRTTKN